MGKGRTITAIKAIIDKWGGSISTNDMESESSPIYNQVSKDHYSLIERFYRDEVEVVTYVHQQEVDVFNVSYENIDEDLLEEIYNELEAYDVGMDKTLDICRDEDWN